jgi:hypothetical protein
MKQKKYKIHEPDRNSAPSNKTKANNSLEHRHFEKLEEFQNKEKVIQREKKAIVQLQKELNFLEKEYNIKNVTNNVVYNKFTDLYLTIEKKKEEIANKEREIQKISSGEDEIEYLLNTYHIMNEYCNLQEKEREILESFSKKEDAQLQNKKNGNTPKSKKESKKNKMNTSGNSSNIMSFFGGGDEINEPALIEQKEEKELEQKEEKEEKEEDNVNENIDYLDYGDELAHVFKKKNVLADEYNKILYGNDYVSSNLIVNIKDSGVCPDCNEQQILEKGYLICTNCGLSILGIADNNTASFKEMQNYEYKPQFTYMKQTHFEDWIRRFQAKENTTIDQEILDKVILELKKEKIKDLSNLEEAKVKKILKKLNYNKYYDHVVHIIHRLNGIPPLRLTEELENKLRQMFLQIQEPFEKHKPDSRKNFLSYSYVLHKFFQILNLEEYTKYFALLKSPEKLRQQDEIFKKIVKEMAEKDKSIKWVFIPSI